MTEPVAFRPIEILRVLDRHQVRFVVIGGVAATIHGAAHVTFDIDITPDADVDNADRLSAALIDLDARVRTDAVPEGLAFQHDGASLVRAQVWNLTTRFGELDLSFTPSGTSGYPDLVRDAATSELRGLRVLVASLADVVRSKEAAGRPKDLLVLPTLRRLLEEPQQ